ncbi:MAG: hypothetical protein M1834_009299 [Cirrosporium novae-zelandiae]|nr:MAG: hypothetical protein M1834_009299 [Cirrosporium novae-zelandiae]
MTNTIFITGASSGVGLASAKLFYKNGWNVVATMRSPDKATELKEFDTSRMLVQRLDLQDKETIAPAINAALSKFTKVDVLLNNAGYGQYGVFEMLPPERIQEQFDVNLFGHMNVIRGMLPHFRANNNNSGIINVSSGVGLFAVPLSCLYAASKFALEGFSEALSYELATQNIFVKNVIPHGGISSTNFLQSSLAKASLDPALFPSYGDLISKMMKTFEGMAAAASISSDDVAGVIYEAATDGSNRFRYLVGNDESGFIKARYESTTDEEYMSRMRATFQ